MKLKEVEKEVEGESKKKEEKKVKKERSALWKKNEAPEVRDS